MTQTIQQQRAAYAMKRVLDAANDASIHSEYKSYASSLPAMIHTNGLGQAAAFFRSKSAFDKEQSRRSTKEKTYFLLYQTLSDWLCGQGSTITPMPKQPYSKPHKDKPAENYQDMLEGITHEDMHAYRLAQAEAQALMDWIKKFAKAFMVDKSNDQQNASDKESS